MSQVLYEVRDGIAGPNSGKGKIEIVDSTTILKTHMKL